MVKQRVRLATDPDDANFKCDQCGALVHFDPPKNFLAALPPDGKCPKCGAFHALSRYDPDDEIPSWADVEEES